ncbi:hypothetical protein BDV95DRAFT_15682 [Massariosphaeria phaeospora]|uniref:F-box domain-containing protein n=1 Tax=Massariosphaeria phaeospora TaxID=100035 RepID=A0A7C8IN43_9PLEO|nr:hypothetical protein BDV95DRAFT_15682 [Massariosphaeria phaeospora]
MSPRSLPDLPEELIEDVASRCRKPDLANLALASRQLNRIASAVLYRHISIVLKAKNYRSIRHENSLEPLHSITALLLQRPELAACVRHLTLRLDWNDREDTEEGCYADGLLPALEDGVIAMLQRYEAEHSVHTRSSLTSSPKWLVDKFVAVLLSLSLPNLVYLDTDFMRRAGGLFSHRVSLPLNEEESKNLSHVREVLFCSIAKDVLDFSNVEVFFSLPACRKVCMYGLERIHHGVDSERFEEGDDNVLARLKHGRASTSWPTSSVEHLEIRSSTLTFAEICHLIGRCKALHTFGYEHSPDYNDGRDGFSLNMWNVVDALGVHAETLQELYLNAYAGDVTVDGELLDFRKLSHLRHLKIPTDCLTSALAADDGGLIEQGSPDQDALWAQVKKVLPASLQKLTLTGPVKEHTREWRVLFAAVLPRLVYDKTALPELKEIIIQISCKSAPPAQTLLTIQRFAKRQGIELRFFHWYRAVRQRVWGIDEDVHCWAVVPNQRNIASKTAEIDVEGLEDEILEE